MADDGVLNKAQQKIRNDRLKMIAMKVKKDREAAAKRDARAKPTNLGTKMRFKEHTELMENAEAALKKKADKSGFSLSILRKVYKRGVAAWKVGHKPGTTPQQWGMARVNSFITGGRTRVKGDPDLWAQQKGKIRK